MPFNISQLLKEHSAFFLFVYDLPSFGDKDAVFLWNIRLVKLLLQNVIYQNIRILNAVETSNLTFNYLHKTEKARIFK